MTWKMEKDDLVFIIILLLFLGYVWYIPKETIFNGIVTIIAAAIAAGRFLGKKKRKRQSAKKGLNSRPLTDTKRASEYLSEIVDYLNEKGSEEQRKEARALIEKIR